MRRRQSLGQFTGLPRGCFCYLPTGSSVVFDRDLANPGSTFGKNQSYSLPTVVSTEVGNALQFSSSAQSLRISFPAGVSCANGLTMGILCRNQNTNTNNLCLSLDNAKGGANYSGMYCSSSSNVNRFMLDSSVNQTDTTYSIVANDGNWYAFGQSFDAGGTATLNISRIYGPYANNQSPILQQVNYTKTTYSANPFTGVCLGHEPTGYTAVGDWTGQVGGLFLTNAYMPMSELQFWLSHLFIERPMVPSHSYIGIFKSSSVASSASLAATLGAATLSGAATSAAPASSSATASPTLGAVTLSGAATAIGAGTASATLSATLATLTLTASATATGPASSSATSSPTLGAVTLSGAATAIGAGTVSATLSATLATLTLTASATATGTSALPNRWVFATEGIRWTASEGGPVGTTTIIEVDPNGTTEGGY